MKNRYLVAVAAVLVLALLLSTEARAQSVKTGQYNGNGSTTQVATGLTSLKSLTIVHVASRGPSAVAYTTNAIQTSLGLGTFLNGNKKDQGISIEVGNFTVTNSDFNEAGVLYHWEALGD